MTTTNEMIRARMSRELEAAGPMPDLVPRVITQGGRVVRRRRLAVGSTLTAMAVGTGWTVSQTVGSDGPGGSGVSVAGDPAATPSPGTTNAPSEATDAVGDAAYAEAIRATLETVLPDRVGEVDLVGNNPSAPVFRTSGPARLEVNFAVNGWFAGWTLDCAAHDTATSCRQAELDGGWLAVAHHGADDGGMEYATLRLEHEQVQADLNVFAAEGNRLPELTDAELLAAAQDPAFLELVRLGVEHAATSPASEVPQDMGGEGLPSLGPLPTMPAS